MNPILKAFLIFSSLAGPLTSAQAAPITRVQYLMGTICEISVAGLKEKALNEAITAGFEEIARLESILSTYDSESEVSMLNLSGAPASTPSSTDLFSLLRQSIEISKKTGGAFDVTLVENGYQHIALNDLRRTIQFKKEGLTLDFGGIGKGYALDKAVEVLKKRGVKSARLNFSGNILCFSGNQTHELVVLADPHDTNKTVLTLRINNASVSTSSQLEKRNHIVDPRLGKPAEFQGSVTVVSPTATEADALSTALLVLGPQKGLDLLTRQFPDSAALFLIPSKEGWIKSATENFQTYVTPSVN
jgi:thiamine biosynthesis lipoprotein